MSKSLNTLVAALMLAGATNTFAASSVDLTVRGLITPSACEPALSAGGQYDVGKISAKDLNADDFTPLPDHVMQLTVTCDAATLMAIEPQDNRAGSSADDVPSRFGLGLINGTEKLGFLELGLESMVADGVNATGIGSEDGGLTWTRGSSFASGRITSVGDGTVMSPIPVQLLTADLNLTPAIAPSSGLTLDNEVAIDGSVTLTVKYL